MKKKSLWFRRGISVALALATITAARAANTGLAAIGFSAFGSDDRAQLADVYRRAGGNLELAALYFSFDRSEPMREIDRFVKDVVSTSRTLTIRIYLDSGPNRRSDDYGAAFRPGDSPAEFWSLAGGSMSRSSVRKFYSDWLTFIKPAVDWTTAISNWAAEQQLSAKLRFVIVPVLEDDARSNTRAYKLLATATRKGFETAMAATGVSTPVSMLYARNPNGNSGARVSGLLFEAHGDSLAKLRRGDTLSADGVTVSSDAWGRIQLRAMRAGVHSLYWHSSFNGNGDQRDSRPDLRGELHPMKELSKADLVRLLRTR